MNKTIAKAVFKLKANAPTILVVGGLAITIGGTIWAVKRSAKLVPVIEKSHTDMETAKTNQQLKKDLENDIVMVETKSEYDEIMNNPLTPMKVRVNLVKDLAKIYAIPVGMVFLGSFMILKGHNIIRKEVAALGASLTALEARHDRLFNRVAEEHDEETAHMWEDGIRKETIEVEENLKNGKTKTVKKKVYTRETPDYIFDENSNWWHRDPNYRLMFLRQTEKNLTNKLQKDGYLFMDYALDALDIDKEEHPEARILGWTVVSDKNPTSDGFVSFGLYNDERDLIKNPEGIALRFNHDGDIRKKVFGNELIVDGSNEESISDTEESDEAVVYKG